ncbi:hypothetical protein AALG83_02190 [Christensenellaceae bacterium 44-20]
MAREFAKAFYHSSAWLKCRGAYIRERIAIDGGMCQRCHIVPGYIVHHKVWLTPDNISNPDVTLNKENLEYVCLVCHNKIEQGECESGYRFDEMGQLVPIPPFKGSMI